MEETKKQQAIRMIDYCKVQMVKENKLGSHRCFQYLKRELERWEQELNYLERCNINN